MEFKKQTKGGAEIFCRIAAVAADNGMIVSVFDVTKAFNNLRRCDIKDAVNNFANPLLSAFVSYLFERDPIVCFRDFIRSYYSRDRFLFFTLNPVLQNTHCDL